MDLYAFRQNPPAQAAPLNMPAGVTVIEGQVKGLIVQKQDTSDPAQRVFKGWYYLTKGEEVAAIDADGVHKTVPIVDDVGVRQERKPLDDLEILRLATKMPEASSSGRRTKAGGIVMRARTTSLMGPVTNALPLLGEFRIDPKTGQAELIPAIEVATANGVVNIPLAKLIKFKTKDATP